MWYECEYLCWMWRNLQLSQVTCGCNIGDHKSILHTPCSCCQSQVLTAEPSRCFELTLMIPQPCVQNAMLQVSGSSTCASAYVQSCQEQQELPSVVSAVALPGDNLASGTAAGGTFAGRGHSGSTSGWMQLLPGQTAGSFSSCSSHSSSSSLNGSTLQQPSCGKTQGSDGTLHALSMLGPLPLQPLPHRQAAGLQPGVELGGACIPSPLPSLLQTSVLSSTAAAALQSAAVVHTLPLRSRRQVSCWALLGSSPPAQVCQAAALGTAPAP